MAKKKRKSSGGGAFGKSGAKRVPSIHEENEESGVEVMRLRRGADFERQGAVILRKVAGSPGSGPTEDAEEFVALSKRLPARGFVDRFDPEPEAHFRAMALLEERREEDSEEDLRSRIAEALAIDPDCVDAHLLAADLAEEPEGMLRHYQDAAEAGRRKRKAILETEAASGRDPALLVFNHPFLEALFELGDMLWMSGEFAAAQECYREMLAIEPEDPWHVRPALLSLAFALGDLEDAEAILDEDETGNSCAMLYGRAYLEFVRALEESPDYRPDANADGPFDGLRTPTMEKAREALRTAFRTCPWAVSFVLDSRTILLNPMISFTTGDPFDALEFARMNFNLWSVPGAPAIWLLTEFGLERELPSATLRLLRRHHAEFLEALDLLDELEAPDLEGIEGEDFIEELVDASRQIAEILEDRGQGPRGRRRFD